MTRTEIAAAALPSCLAAIDKLGSAVEPLMVPTGASRVAFVIADAFLAEAAKTPNTGEQLRASVLVGVLEKWVDSYKIPHTEFRVKYMVPESMTCADWLLAESRAAIAAARGAA